MSYNSSKNVNPQFKKTLKDYSKRKIAMNYPLFYKLGYKLLKTDEHVKHFKTQIHFFYICCF